MVPCTSHCKVPGTGGRTRWRRGELCRSERVRCARDFGAELAHTTTGWMEPTLRRRRMGKDKKATKKTPGIKDLVQPAQGRDVRSEERRVGKEGRSRRPRS